MYSVFLGGLARAFLDSYRKRRWLWHLIAALLTYLLVASGFDWWFYVQTRNQALMPLIYFAGISGFYVPVLVPIGLYIYGRAHSRDDSIQAAASAAQAVIISWIVVALYKTFTGRLQPEFFYVASSPDISHTFQFGFFRNGIFWGWPSSHTAVITALTASLLPFLSRSQRLLLVVYACSVAFGAGVGFHWFSDVLAGAIIGIVIGTAVAAQRRLGSPAQITRRT